jgi:hypothetical protein
MSRHILRLVALLFTLALGTGCASYMPFTQELRSEYDLADTDLENLQFYNSHTITLRRELSRDSRRITGGHKLLMIAGKQIEEVVIDARTPGVVVGASPSTLRVSFAEGSFLEFALRGSVPGGDPVVLLHGGFAEPPEPFPGDRQPFVALPLGASSSARATSGCCRAADARSSSREWPTTPSRTPRSRTWSSAPSRSKRSTSRRPCSRGGNSE